MKHWTYLEVLWALDLPLDFHIYSGKQVSSRSDAFVLLIAPYWSIVLPMTALSAWLLLSKPRKAAKVPA